MNDFDGYTEWSPTYSGMYKDEFADEIEAREMTGCLGFRLSPKSVLMEFDNKLSVIETAEAILQHEAIDRLCVDCQETEEDCTCDICPDCGEHWFGCECDE